MNLIATTFNEIFNNQKLAQASVSLNRSKRPKVGADELQLAVIVLLVDLASCDQSFDNAEFEAICAGMQRHFDLTQREIAQHMQAAKIALATLRGVSRFAELLREHFTEEQRKLVMQVVEDVIAADGREDAFEIYVRQKFQTLLGLASTPASADE